MKESYGINIYKYRILIKNNYHEFNNEQWHLISIYREWHNTRYCFTFGLIGFKISVFKRNKFLYQ